ncbi:sulfotransferase domain-containing protein [Thiohalophilus sp.]|uniref:sulfotransferase domain-containing protein n=1 Tax=Thiohalophilus sp. TaxID=3028392 RepID=UPI002ACE4C42|nr:sulfotransferase domain-containing protein [Thiohalophilus sp.]MDZ7662816.1 sulfotransferase domain-containing protein [Thiohalophilus sp.]
MDNVLVVWRDGRDILISQYFHSLFKNEKGNSVLVDSCRADLGFQDYENISANLVQFMEYIYETKHHPRFSWVDFANRWVGCEHCTHVFYEDLRSHPARELQRIINSLSGISLDADQCKKIVCCHSFEKKAGRKPGEENSHSFMRKGVVGDWKNYFTCEARERFHAYAGDALIRLGYEDDDAWVKVGEVKNKLPFRFV